MFGLAYFLANLDMGQKKSTEVFLLNAKQFNFT